MKTIYFIDDYCDSSHNGLATYHEAISIGMSSIPDVRLVNVWVNSTKYLRVQKEFKKRGYQLHIPMFADQKTKYFQIYKCLEADIGEKQQVIIHFNWIHHLAIAWFIKRYTKCITVFTSHCIMWRDFVTDDFDEFYRMDTAFQNCQPLKKPHPKVFREKILYESVDHFITVTTKAKKSLEFFYDIPSEKITTIRNGLDVKVEVEKRLGKEEALRVRYGIGSTDKVILYVGRLSKRKGVIDLTVGFESFLEKYPTENIKLILIGDGDYGQILKACRKYWSQIILTGPLNKDEIYNFYTLANIGIIPSYIEQCSYTAIEMMMFSLPVIVSDIDGLAEMVQSDSGLKIPVRFNKEKDTFLDLEKLHQSIFYLLNNKHEAVKMAGNASQNALKLFSSDGMIKKTIGLYRKEFDGVKNIDFQKHSVKPVYIKKVIKPKVSVVLPCYNGEKYLHECLESILCQSFQDFELLFIDDGSSDKSKEIARSFGDSRLIYLENPENKGITNSLNKGISNAKGKYIARIDADDLMAEDRLAIQFSFLENHQDYGLVSSSFEVIDQFGMVINRVDQIADSQILKLGMIFQNLIMHPGVMLKTELASRFFYDDEFKFCEDYNLWTKISKVSKIANIPEYLLSYRLHDNNLSLVNNQEMKNNTTAIISRELSNLNIFHTKKDLDMHSSYIFGNINKNFDNDIRKHILQEWIDRILNSLFIRKQFNDSIINNFREIFLGFPSTIHIDDSK